MSISNIVYYKFITIPKTVPKTVKRSLISAKKVIGICLSIKSTSLANRLTTLPLGLVSKKDIGACKTFNNIELCRENIIR